MNAIDRLCTIATDVSLEATTLAADVRAELANMRSAIGRALADMKDVDEPCDGGSWCFVHDDHVPIDSEHCHTHQGHLRLQALLPEAPMSARTTSDHIDGLTGEVVAQMDRADAITAAARALLDELATMRSAIRKALPLLVRRSDVECEGGDWCSVHDDFMHDLDRCFTAEGVDLLRTALNSSAPQVVPLPGECPAVPAAGEALAPELPVGGSSGAGGHEFVSDYWSEPEYGSACLCGWKSPGRMAITEARALYLKHVASLAP